VAAGSTVTFTYVVTDTGGAPVANVAVTDDKLGPITSFTGDTNGDGLLDPTETWTYTAAAIALAGQQTNVGTVTGQDVNTLTTVTDDNPANYFGDAGTGDILWHNVANGGTSIWEMNGGQLAAQPVSLGLINTDWQVAGVGDFNGDSTSDILWHNSVTGGTSIWEMNNGQLAAQPISLGMIMTDWQIADVGDFNGDSTSDILWRNVNTGQASIWQMDDGLLATPPSSFGNINTDWQIAGVGDFIA
jgi:phage FluMu protein gp41